MGSGGVERDPGLNPTTNFSYPRFASSSLTENNIQDPHENDADASLEILSPEWCAPDVLSGSPAVTTSS